MTDIPLAMVDELTSEGYGPGPEGLAFARAYVADGDLDPALVAALRDPERERRTAERKAQDWPAIGQYRDANAALAGQPVDVVFMGDSITEIWAVAHPDLFSGGNVGRGISGQTTPQILLRFMPDVVALKPRAVHLLCGGNDICGNTGPSTPQDFKNNILAMVSVAEANGIAVILASILPFREAPWTPAVTDAGPRIAELNTWLAGLTAERALVYADYWPALADTDGRLRTDFTRDGVHPNGRGYDAMRPITDRAIARALGEA